MNNKHLLTWSEIGGSIFLVFEPSLAPLPVAYALDLLVTIWHEIVRKSEEIASDEHDSLLIHYPNCPLCYAIRDCQYCPAQLLPGAHGCLDLTSVVAWRRRPSLHNARAVLADAIKVRDLCSPDLD